jgi:hypothetical protein
VAGRLAAVAGLPRVLRERRRIQGARVASDEAVAAVLRAPGALERGR